MKTLSSVEVQNHFGSIANIVKSGEPVAVTQYGTPTLMILPYGLAAEALRDYNAASWLNSWKRCRLPVRMRPI